MMSLQKNEIMALISLFASSYSHGASIAGISIDGTRISSNVEDFKISKGGVTFGQDYMEFKNIDRIEAHGGEMFFSKYCLKVITKTNIFAMSPLSSPIVECRSKFYPIAQVH